MKNVRRRRHIMLTARAPTTHPCQFPTGNSATTKVLACRALYRRCKPVAYPPAARASMDEQASSGNLELMSGRLKNPISSDEVANPSRFQRKPMRIKKLNNSNVLEIGQ